MSLTPMHEPFRVGFWCAYGSTLLPHDGIGVFTYELIEALLANHPDVEVCVAVRAGDVPLLGEFAARHPHRLKIVGNDHPDALRAKAVAQRDRTFAARYSRATARPTRWFTRLRNWGRGLRQRPLTPGLVATVAVAWPVLVLAKLMGLLFWPFRKRHRAWVARAEAPVTLPFDAFTPTDFELKQMQPQALAHAAGCAIWVYPYLGVLQEIRSHPSVLFIHDLVFSRFPEYFGRANVDALEFVLRHRCDEATLFACMSEFIRTNDLIGMLKISPQRIRMIRPGVPRDCWPSGAPVPEESRRIPTRYFLFPGGIRGYKNHTGLVAGLAELQRVGIVADLVFTTATRASAPAELKELIRTSGLQGRVHFVGTVSRDELKTLYRQAVATVVPSLYEQGSFPIYESVLLGCPVACSDIPSLREQSAGFGDAMLYFDPRDPVAIAGAMQKLWNERDDHATRQLDAAHRVWPKSWDDIAAGWLAVFREAVVLHRGGEPSG